MPELILADCVEAMRGLEPCSVDAVVCDGPYGLEFMGKEWDRLDAGLPQESVWKGRRGKGGSVVGGDKSKPGGRHGIGYGGKHHGFKRCRTCGKRQFSGSPCTCAEPDWEIEYAQRAPTSVVRMQRWHEQWCREAYRVLKPGGHCLAFGGTRTYHRLACAMEDAGFEIRDSLHWVYGSGFPKSRDVSKAIDQEAGAEREVVGQNPYNARRPNAPVSDRCAQAGWPSDITTPATPAAQQWEGWGTALKPAHEPIVVARKPLDGTVAQCVQKWGTGGVNVDGCRVGTDTSRGDRFHGKAPGGGGSPIDFGGRPDVWSVKPGRWPPNLLLGHQPDCGEECVEGCPVKALDAGSDGAARFYPQLDWSDLDFPGLYQAKASRRERSAGVGVNAHPT